jgi:hypothetical protein
MEGAGEFEGVLDHGVPPTRTTQWLCSSAWARVGGVVGEGQRTPEPWAELVVSWV